MSQADQLVRPQQQEEPIKYGDVFDIQGVLADKPVAPKDAALMQLAENFLLGQVQLGGAAATMQSAAAKNERAGVVSHCSINEEAAVRGVTVTKEEFSGHRVITESVGGQVVGQYRQPAPPKANGSPLAGDQEERGGDGGNRGDVIRAGPITIGEALEATTLTAGQKPVERSDAAAIQAAEMRATGRTTIVRGGVAAVAQSAATINAKVTRDEDKMKLADVLADASSRLPSDKPATRGDAERVTGAEMRNDPFMTTHPAGVAASVAAAARLNASDQHYKSRVAGNKIATRKGRPGVVCTNEPAGVHGVTVTEEESPSQRVITESVDGKVVGEYRQPVAPPRAAGGSPKAVDKEKRGGKGGKGGKEVSFCGGRNGPITIGEALEAAVLTAGDKPVERSDAAAIQVAEMRATGRTTIIPGGVAAAAQSAATLNARLTRDEDKTKLADVLEDASTRLPSDKPATREDVEAVTGAEMRNDPYLTTHPAGVAASLAAAARLNTTGAEKPRK